MITEKSDVEQKRDALKAHQEARVEYYRQLLAANRLVGKHQSLEHIGHEHHQQATIDVLVHDAAVNLSRTFSMLFSLAHINEELDI